MKANRPVQAFVGFIESALNQIANHRDQFIETFALRRHFRLVADRNECIVFTLDLKNELFHGDNLTALPRESNFSFANANAKMRQREGDRVWIRRAKSLMGKLK